MMPPLREELSIHPGPSDRDGAPTWSLHDPARNVFFRIDWLTFEILSRWHLGDAGAIATAIDRETPIQPEADDVDTVARFLLHNELVRRHDAEGTGWFAEQERKSRVSFSHWLLHRYLFFRVPLWRPDAWLDRNLSRVRFLFTRGFFLLTLAALAVGLLQVSAQWDRFVTTLVDTFSIAGLAGFLVALAGVKLLHELAHAFAAKHHGCRVPTMGVAFLVLFPMAYTDVNEAWKLPDRRKRLAIGAAGILAELAVAAWATAAWAALPDGYLRGAAFLLATTTWVSSVIINASPFLRFDGYFLLMDWLDVPNLHQRAFDLARWRLREWLFAFGEPLPADFPPARRRGLILFAWLTWAYRCVVFGGIAVVVYQMFPKPLGPMLAAVEIGWFIALPIWREFGEWRARWPAIRRSLRARGMLLPVALLLGATVLPWDTRIHSQGLLRPAQHVPVVAPGPSVVASMPVGDGQHIGAGQPLIELEAPELAFQGQAAQARAATLRWQGAAAGVDPKLREQQQVIEAAQGKVRAELDGIMQSRLRYAPIAPFAGRLFLSHPDLQTGAWVGKNERLGVLSDTSHWLVETYLPEAELDRIRTGDGGRFYSETPDVAALPVRVERIDRDATHVLPDPILASAHGGRFQVREHHRRLIPEAALYRVTLALESPHEPRVAQVLRGKVVLFGRPQSHADEFLRTAGAWLVREAGF